MFSLLLQQSDDLLHRAVRCPGFLYTAVLCYIRLLQLFLDGHTLTPTTEPPEQQVLSPYMIRTTLKPVTSLWNQIHTLYCQVEPSQILSHAKQFVLRVISQTSPTALLSSQLRQVTDSHKHLQYHQVKLTTCPQLIISPCLVSVSWSSWSPSVQTWTQRWQQLSPSTSVLTAWVQRWISSEQQKTAVQELWHLLYCKVHLPFNSSCRNHIKHKHVPKSSWNFVKKNNKLTKTSILFTFCTWSSQDGIIHMYTWSPLQYAVIKTVT